MVFGIHGSIMTSFMYSIVISKKVMEKKGNQFYFRKIIRNWFLSIYFLRFSAVDYMLPTPTWALMGSKERGFDPVEKRFHKKRGVNRNDG